MTINPKVVLFYTPYDRPPLGAPLGFFKFRSPHLAGGFDALAADRVTSPDFEPWLYAVLPTGRQWTFCELVERLPGGHSGNGIRRISFKQGADVHHEMGRPVASLKAFRHLPSTSPYLIDPSYQDYANSTGCPYASNYSTGMVSCVE